LFIKSIQQQREGLIKKEAHLDFCVKFCKCNIICIYFIRC